MPALTEKTTLPTLLKHTTSRCGVCRAACPAEVIRNGREVHLVRHCPDHGKQRSVISSDARFYHLSKGNGGCCESTADSFQSLSTCLALIEIVHSCNLSCPTCYADSPVGVGGKLDAVPVEEIKSRIQGVIDRKGGIEILQLSGGEPTLHPQFFEIVEWVNANPGIDYLLVNTNGVLIAKDDAVLEQFGEHVRYGHIQVYLQFDGTEAESNLTLRGADLRELKQRAVERCGEIGLPLTLAMTVVPGNLGDLWNTIQFGLKYSHVRGATFQPMFGSGRCGNSETRRLNTADIIIAAVTQSDGQLKFDDFTPLPCGDPNCATIGYLLKTEQGLRSISDFVDFAQVQGFLRDRLRYRLEDLTQCGCESEPLGQILKDFELDERHTFRLFIKPFMDADSWDEDRIDRCCTHVVRPDGELDSFCRYYSGFPDC